MTCSDVKHLEGFSFIEARYTQSFLSKVKPGQLTFEDDFKKLMDKNIMLLKNVPFDSKDFIG